MNEYPKKIVLEDKKLVALLGQKEPLVLQGRAKSEEIELVEKEMADIDVEIQALEKKVDVKDLDVRAQEITERFNSIMAEMEGVKKELLERVKTGVPVEMIEKYETAKKNKEKLETERNKIALKVQKLNDKLIPWTRRVMKPHLVDMFDDIEGLKVEDGQLIGTIFNHMQDYTNRFIENKKKN